MVQVIFGQKATRQTSNTFVLTDGSQLTADVTFYTIGGQPNTRFLNGLGILAASGAIKVAVTKTWRLPTMRSTIEQMCRCKPAHGQAVGIFCPENQRDCPHHLAGLPLGTALVLRSD